MQRVLRRRRQAGLTLIELLVVMVIMVILAGSITFYVANRADQARASRARTDLHAISIGLEAYNNAMAEFPTTEQGLTALVVPTGLESTQQTKWRSGGGPFLTQRNFRDPWGNEYVYVNPGPDGRDYDLICLGADGRPGGTAVKDEDISVWDEDSPR